jgi:hemerythrin
MAIRVLGFSQVREAIMGIAVYWDPKYSVNDATIDSEHQKLFDLANRVFAIMDVDAELPLLKATILDLYSYMEYHFGHEEELMSAVGFDGFQAHVRQHQRIIAEMNGLLTLSGTVNELLGKLRHVMVDWVLGHIIDQDSRMASAVCHARVAAASASG